MKTKTSSPSCTKLPYSPHEVFSMPLPIGNGFYPLWDPTGKEWENYLVCISNRDGYCEVQAMLGRNESKWLNIWSSVGGVEERPCTHYPASYSVHTVKNKKGEVLLGGVYRNSRDTALYAYELALGTMWKVTDKPIAKPTEHFDAPSATSIGAGSAGAPGTTPVETPIGPITLLGCLLVITLYITAGMSTDNLWVSCWLFGKGGPYDIGWLLLVALGVLLARLVPNPRIKIPCIHFKRNNRTLPNVPGVRYLFT